MEALFYGIDISGFFYIPFAFWLLLYVPFYDHFY